MPTTKSGVEISADWGKLAIIVVLLTIVTVLSITDHLDSAVTTAILFATAGYVFGNGALALQGKQNSPAIKGTKPIEIEEEGN